MSLELVSLALLNCALSNPVLYSKMMKDILDRFVNLANYKKIIHSTLIYVKMIILGKAAQEEFVILNSMKKIIVVMI